MSERSGHSAWNQGWSRSMKLEGETRMTIGVLVRHGQSGRAIARILGVDESTVRYHLARQQSNAIDCLSLQVPKAAG
jgi:hypothetical protein